VRRLIISHRFRWVFCQLEVLRHCFPANLRHALEELPKSLDETYKRILNEINNANREHAYRLLQCLTVAHRPLRVEELADVLEVDVNVGGIPKLNENWRWEDQEEAVLSACSSLVTVVISYGSRVVQFSVKEFLTSDRLRSCKEEVSRFHTPIEPSHLIFAQACLGVLLCLNDCTNEDRAKKIPLLQYAGAHWYRRARVGNVELQIKDALHHFFDVDKLHLLAWARTDNHEVDPFFWASTGIGMPDRHRRRSVLLPATPLYFAAWIGLRGVVEHLISKYPEQVNCLGGKFGTPLHSSVAGGNIVISKLLFMHGADINSCSASNNTPLHTASQWRHLEIGKWLLSCGADINFRQEDGQAPLHLSAAAGDLEISRMLLEHNADVNAQDDRGDTPFLEASRSGNPDVLQLLLDHNADVHVHDEEGVTPLHYAVNSSHLKVAQILLKCNVDVNARDSRGATPFLKALKGGNPHVIRLLLDHNADIQVHDNEGVTPLHQAAIGGHLEVARILLEHNMEVNVRDDEGATPSHRASERGNADIVGLLLDHNADVQVRDNMGVTPLHEAAYRGHLEVIRILLEHNAEVNAR
jgi:ankyrin repeat protein